MAHPGPVMLLLAIFGAMCRRAGATAFDVGGDDGWAVPPSKDGGMYNQWASKNRFLVGDSVHFKYKKDSVMVVTEDDYNNCRASHPIFFSNNGDTSVALDRPGLFYFISGVAGHCERGQRMIIKVIAGDAPPPTPQSPSPAQAPPTPPSAPQAPPTPPSPLSPSGAAPGTRVLAVTVAAVTVLLVIVLGV